MLLDSPQSVKALSVIERLSKVSPPGFRTQSFFRRRQADAGRKARGLLELVLHLGNPVEVTGQVRHGCYARFRHFYRRILVGGL